ncbi:MAG: adenylate/guanylate cyclase domain-containing protein [Candidatus Limnocylindrales bacterium]
MRMIGKRPSDKNPTMCASCFTFMSRNHGGAEIDCTLLFADIRGSTTIAERMTATAFRDLIDHFYTVATEVVFEHDGAVDKFAGDELVATFFPLLSGEAHAAHGVAAASALLRATGHADPGGPWVPLGAGVHTGPTWVGAVGDQARRELTILGDSVNTTARLASVASEGEILVTSDAAQAANLGSELPRRSLELRGKAGSTDVVVIDVRPPDRS